MLQPDLVLRLRVAVISDAARGIRTIELVEPGGAELPAFTPGAHLPVLTPAGALRKYSLCNDANERHRYLIAVKCEEDGRGGSLSMHRDLLLGDTLEAGMPSNAFPFVEAAKSYIFIAGGIGITPMLSMIRTFGELPPAPWKLYYLARERESTAFLDDLAQPEYRSNVVTHFDGGKPEKAFDLWPVLEKANAGHVYCCGPRGLMDAVRDMTGHWSSANVHFESFNEGGTPRPNDQAFIVTLARSGRQVEVAVGQTILQALNAGGCTVPYSCESGTCGTCRTRVLAGTPDHRDMVLMPEEMESQIMVCVSRSSTPELVLDL